jgi:hypothetical protein
MKSLLKPLCLAAALIAGCAGNPFASGVQPGSTRDQVIARMGQPTAIVPLPAGERLQFSGQPFGQWAYMVDLDRSGRVIQSRQVLTANEFDRIETGKWTREDVEREFGRPAKIERVWSWNGPIMTYRWYGYSDMFYHVYLDERGVVHRAHPAMEFLNAPTERI